ncbi:MAG: type II toxin-antitoxin system HipA family toxin [Opitutales bacterium]
MQRCPITYAPLQKGETRYSQAGLRRLHPRLERLDVLPFSPETLLQEAARRATRMSIQGVQPKLSAVLEVARQRMQVVDTGGRFILKPPNPAYPDLPENEDLTLKLAALLGLEVPDHGLLWANGSSLVFWIRRFDRHGQKNRRHVEDFAQLAGESRETKYDASVERVIQLIERYCTFPVVEKARFYERFLFNWVVGNDDMHLKNYSVWAERGTYRLSPCYDFLCTALVLDNAIESALPLSGKNSRFTRQLLVDYLGKERCGLPDKVVDKTLARLVDSLPKWRPVIGQSFLPEDAQQRYLSLIQERLQRLQGH